MTDDIDILAFGDSLIAGYGLARAQGFAPQLEAALRGRGVAANVINAGISGDTVAAGWARLPRTIERLERRPDLAIVALGGNDMLRMVPPHMTREGLEAILAEFARREVPVLMAGMYAAPFLSRQYQAEFNAIYPALARRFGAALYPFFLAGVAGVPRLNLFDRVHPNERGIARMVEGILPYVLRALPTGEA
ncbi:MAG: acyl-CoA thioesterase [Sphingomonadales bacterium]|jgi:acyl-CoA thioesterase-1|nr:acyl-CoA thioesterase [Sphingomonadales bacterium]